MQTTRMKMAQEIFTVINGNNALTKSYFVIPIRFRFTFEPTKYRELKDPLFPKIYKLYITHAHLLKKNNNRSMRGREFFTREKEDIVKQT